VIKELGFNSVTGCVLRFVKHEAERIMPMRMGMALMTILMTVGLSDAFSSNSSWSPSDRWHIAGTPSVISQEVQFANAGANLVGTVYLPNVGNHLPAVVALHHAGVGTREAALYRHLSLRRFRSVGSRRPIRAAAKGVEQPAPQYRESDYRQRKPRTDVSTERDDAIGR